MLKVILCKLFSFKAKLILRQRICSPEPQYGMYDDYDPSRDYSTYEPLLQLLLYVSNWSGRDENWTYRSVIPATYHSATTSQRGMSRLNNKTNTSLMKTATPDSNQHTKAQTVDTILFCTISYRKLHQTPTNTPKHRQLTPSCFAQYLFFTYTDRSAFLFQFSHKFHNKTTCRIMFLST